MNISWFYVYLWLYWPLRFALSSQTGTMFSSSRCFPTFIETTGTSAINLKAHQQISVTIAGSV